MSFIDVYKTLNWDSIQEEIYQKNSNDVELALSKPTGGTLEDFKALVSPAADPYLEALALKSQILTRQHFGNTIQLYIPLYLSNECSNSCVYCGFSRKNTIERLTLNLEEVLSEAAIIKNSGFEHVLLVSGESKSVDLDYLRRCLKALRPIFANISMEVPPMNETEYRSLVDEGLYAVYLYQETYGPKFSEYHPKGKKKDIALRLAAPDHLGAAGIHKMGLGFLIGLDDWRVDAWFTAAHLQYLERKYWRSRFSISFPRLRTAQGGFQPPIVMQDRQLLQLICAFRLFNEKVELSLSTRETELFRNSVLNLGITAMSAGSKTNPGGYGLYEENLDQFQVEDTRSPQQVAAMIASQGYDVVWKDWFRV